MNAQTQTSSGMKPLYVVWLLLSGLTLLSVALGQGFHSANWLPLLVAAIVWVKGWLVSRYFIETQLATPFIRRLVAVFIAFAPLALVITGFFGASIARWTALFIG
ncbi:MAG: hypothetical protein EKK59_09630 [Neisseriaceae bacterium]|jgi:hypothetical protein|nr:MAG: hypothetical protein EKK59_09630 [Neisseriaceae bacterium]